MAACAGEAERVVRLFLYETAALVCPKFGIGALGGEQFFVRALLYNGTVVQYKYPVHLLNSAQAVGNYYSCLPIH